jgi:tetratricopeptide (TPR) repeat protein
VRARIALGRICLGQAKYDEAFDHYDPALQLIEETGDKWQERVLRNSLAVVHYCRGDFARALDAALFSLRLCEQVGDRAREGDNATVVGIVYLELGLFDLARRNLEGALAIHQETGTQWSEAETMVYLGLLDAAARRFHSALRFLEQAKTIAERIGARYIAINARNAIAWTLCERNSANDAVRAVDEATEAAETARNARLLVGEIPGLSRSARATALLGDLDAARALSRRAVELLSEQRIIESSEEEIYYTHFRIVAALNDPAALEHLDAAHAGFISKRERLGRADWQEAYEQVRLNAAIRRDHARLSTQS